MFEKLIERRKIKKLFNIWYGTPEKAYPDEIVSVKTVLYVDSIRKRSSIFKNNYVCTDASIIAVLCLVNYLNHCSVPDFVVNDLIKKTCQCCKCLFGLSYDDLNKIKKNRSDYFLNLINESSDIQPLIDESVKLFTYDLNYNKYFEFNKESLLLIDERQYIINIETTNYFCTVIPMVIDYAEHFLPH